jgi:hypothetical protein
MVECRRDLRHGGGNHRDVRSALLRCLRREGDVRRTRAGAGRPGEARVTTVLSELLDDLPAHAAVVGHDGTIVAVNQGWRRFAADNGLDDGVYGLGSNYLDICSSCSTDPFADEARQALKAVLDGRLERFAFTYPCHSDDEKRWFFCLFLAVPEGAVVLHFNHLQQMDGHRLMRDATHRIRALYEDEEATAPAVALAGGSDRRAAAAGG